MTHRIITAEEARTLREAATPGPWTHNWRGPEDGAPGDLWHTGGCGGPLTREADWELAAQAPDLAASVEALHAEVERLRSRLSWTSRKLEAILKDLELTLEDAP
jgi:hypothetical protein